MKLIRAVLPGFPEGVYGRLEVDRLELMAGSPTSTEGLTPTGQRVALSAIVRWLPPVTPVNVLCIGVNYRNHGAECEIRGPPPPPPGVVVGRTR